MSKTITVEDIARTCHEAHRAYCQAIGDTSIRSWDEAETWQKNQTLAGVRQRLVNLDAHPSVCHESWVERQRADGWQYGPEKDLVRKLHPCMLPYANLPLTDQIKDVLFASVVKSLAPMCVEAPPTTPEPLAAAS